MPRGTKRAPAGSFDDPAGAVSRAGEPDGGAGPADHAAAGSPARPLRAGTAAGAVSGSSAKQPRLTTAIPAR
ncbi:hypothetical protein GCM10010249_50140 [Streptomyces roseolilacinus]|uniref:Uncharacterized protein n=1 Tax=Streptomyces roseolilacinus TaxID=66904 RepID=A0A918B4E3_9ACTN|nr:hypothetical protein GCM10010249_50140 [Streptomyces roseolilacinus]